MALCYLFLLEVVGHSHMTKYSSFFLRNILELAMGLAMSGRRFIWVVRCPNNDSADAGYLTDNGHVDPHVFLPKGFIY